MATYLYLSITHCNEASVTRLVYFLTGFGDKVSYKSSPKNWQLLGLFIKQHFSVLLLWQPFGILSERKLDYFLLYHLATLNGAKEGVSMLKQIML